MLRSGTRNSSANISQECPARPYSRIATAAAAAPSVRSRRRTARSLLVRGCSDSDSITIVSDGSTVHGGNHRGAREPDVDTGADQRAQVGEGCVGWNAGPDPVRARAWLLPPRHLHVWPLVLPDVDLSRSRDLLVLVLQHLLPLREPACSARDCEEHREHVDREAHRLVDDARIEIDVRIEPARDEVVVLEGDALELHCEVGQRGLPGGVGHLVARLLQAAGTRRAVLVPPVPDARHADLARLHALAVRADVLPVTVLVQHAHHLLARAA